MLSIPASKKFLLYGMISAHEIYVNYHLTSSQILSEDIRLMKKSFRPFPPIIIFVGM